MGLFDGLKKNKEDASLTNYRKTGLNTNLSNYGWYECVHCHKKFRKGDIDIDHILPQSRGGGNQPQNLQCLCKHCNRSKGNDMSQTKVDLRQRKQSYGQYKREEILKPKLEEKKKEIRENYLSKLSNEEILKCLKSLDFRDGWTELKREARKRGLM